MAELDELFECFNERETDREQLKPVVIEEEVQAR